LRARAQIVYKFRKKILSRVHGNFEEQYKILESSIIITNYYIIIINVYYNYIINALNDYRIVNKGLVQKCDREENVAYLGLLMPPVCIEGRITFSSMSNIRPFTTRPAVLTRSVFGSIGNSYTVSTQSRMWPYTHSSQYRDSGLANEINKKKGKPVNVSCHGNFSACHFGNASPALGVLFAARTRLLVYKCAHIAATKPVLWLKARAL